MVKAVFLDRDGVIVRPTMRGGKPCAPRRLDEFEFLPNVKLACHHLIGAGYMLFIVTNQPDVGNGFISAKTLEAMHKRVSKELPITKIYCCVHSRTTDCKCRKPKPGMLLQAQQEFNIDMTQSWMIGDSDTDVEAGNAAFCKPILLSDDVDYAADTYQCTAAVDLLTASKFILGERHDH